MPLASSEASIASGRRAGSIAACSKPDSAPMPPRAMEIHAITLTKAEREGSIGGRLMGGL